MIYTTLAMSFRSAEDYERCMDMLDEEGVDYEQTNYETTDGE